MAVKRGLGRGLGLEALIPEPTEEEKKSAAELRIIDVEPNRSQPRKRFDQEKLKALSDSIAQYGVIQPILVRKQGERYEIIAGERRWRAAKLAGLKTIPAVIRDTEDSGVMEMAMLENLQREDLNPMEEARGYRTLMDSFGLTQEEIAKRLGKSRSGIANSLRFLHLEEKVQALLENGDISEGHAKVILALPAKAQFDLAKRVIEENLSVRDCEKIINQLPKKKEKKPTKQEEEVKRYLLSLEKELAKHVGSKVHIVSGKKKGRIEIEYYSDEDFERILKLLKGAEA